jgi:hypothetical protein
MPGVELHDFEDLPDETPVSSVGRGVDTWGGPRPIVTDVPGLQFRPLGRGGSGLREGETAMTGAHGATARRAVGLVMPAIVVASAGPAA